MLIDTHAHLDFDQFNTDREEVIERAFFNGVRKIINIGCDLKSSQASVELAKKYENVYAAVGVHPDEIRNSNIEILNKFQIPISKLTKKTTDINKNCLEFGVSNFEFSASNLQFKKIIEGLERLLRGSSKIVAIGEIGLDYYWMNCPKELQVKALKEQLRLAKEFELPVILHCRNSKDEKMNAYEDCLQILIEEKIEKAVFHCFSGTLEFAKKVWDKFFLTSFTGIVTYPNAKEVQEVVRNCPSDLFMIETDCPFLAPQKYRGQRNEPSFVIEVAKKIAELKSLEIDEIGKKATENAERFFKIKK